MAKKYLKTQKQLEKEQNRELLRPFYIARGQRVESLRNLLGLSRRSFSEKYGIPGSTMQNWEDAKSSGLSEKGALSLVQIFKKEGIHFTYEWLMEGVGTGPEIINRVYLEKRGIAAQHHASSEMDDAQIIEELGLFQQHHPDAIHLIVEDDGMLPRYIVGEWVAGRRYYQEAIDNLVGMDCIAQTIEGNVLLRNLRKSLLSQRYTLACSNNETSVIRPILYDVELISAAPVIWTRRKMVY